MFQRPILCHRLFFALFPPPVLARQMVEAVGVSPCRAMLAARVHLTLFVLDDLPRIDPVLVETMRAIGAGVDAAPVEVTLDRLVARGGSIALRPDRANARLADLHRELARLAKAAGVAERRDYRFSPHVTLGYDCPAPVNQRVTPVGWTADALVLIHSRVGQTRHEPLGRWRLDGAASAAQLALF